MKRNPFPILILCGYLCLAFAYSVKNPVFESPDEVYHYLYIRHLLDERNLPVQLRTSPKSQSHHPPLYYAIGALATFWVSGEDLPHIIHRYNPYRGYGYLEVRNDNKNFYLHGDWDSFPYKGTPLGVHIVRWLSVLMGALTVYITYLVAKEIFPLPFALGGMAFVAFNPMFLFISGAVNNDNLITLFGSLTILYSMRLIKERISIRRSILLGIILGFALLTKISALFLIPVIVIAAFSDAFLRRSWRPLLRSLTVIFLVALAISGWWFVRNLIIYGEPTGLRRMLEVWEVKREPSYKLYLVLFEVPHSWRSFWGQFGHGQILLPDQIYSSLGWLAKLASIGLLILGYRQLRWRILSRIALCQLFTLLLTPFSFLLGMMGYMSLTAIGSIGRHLFPSLPAIGVLLFLGLSQLIPEKLMGHLAGVANSSMVAFSLICLLFYIAPAYAKPPLLSQEEIRAIKDRLDISFGGKMKLLGYEIGEKKVKPGGKLSVTLYWQSLAKMEKDYSVFVHLVDDNGIIVAQRDTYPGLGRYQTTLWSVGDAIADRYVLTLPEAAFSPNYASLEVGLYYLPTGERLQAFSSDGKPISDSVRFGEIAILPREGDFPNPLYFDFEGKIALVGYDLDKRMAKPGDVIRLTIYWMALSEMKENYAFFVHLLREGDQIWAGVDKELSPPTSTWEKGEVIVEEYELAISPHAPPDVYEMEMGLLPPDMSRRLRVKWDGASADRIFLSKVKVTPAQ
jgi:hypothetical protein